MGILNIKFKSSKVDLVMVFTILTGFLLICTAIAQSRKERKSDKERIKDKNEIIQLQKDNALKQKENLEKVIELQAQLIASQADLTQSNEKLIAANERLNNLYEELRNYQSGGDSYGFVNLIHTKENNGEQPHALIFNNKGKYPLYDVVITFWDPDEIAVASKDNPPGNFTIDLGKFYTTANLGTVPPKGNATFSNWFIIKVDGIRKINLHIVTKNGNFSEVLRIFKKGDKYSYAWKVNTITDGVNSKPKIVEEHIDKDFPKNESGEIDWK